MSDALKAAGEICDRREWNHDIIPELAKELESYAASLRTPTLDAEGFVRRCVAYGMLLGCQTHHDTPNLCAAAKAVLEPSCPEEDGLTAELKTAMGG